ncbi:MAG: nicotinate (nicotinamide) nucleotide adenylyltransferase [Candidatus Riflebacteria bacterium]|nr:nicotinate (nicotinamide) nucleotide adenylyltransferase [Candidatus Riflebacteria bacterium]
MKIGLFGGSFNPPHKQHLRIAKAAVKSGLVDKVWFVPVFMPVHKSDKDFLSYDDRCRLISAAIQGKKNYDLCTIEKDLGGPSYTINTLRSLRASFPLHDFLLVVGSDSLNDIKNWHLSEKLALEAEIIAAVRPNFPVSESLSAYRYHMIEICESAVSSTEIRRNIAKEPAMFSFLPAPTAALIAAENFFSCWTNDFAGWVSKIKSKYSALPENIIAHLNGTGLLAARYCSEMSADPRLGWLAGISHDLYRASSDEEIKDVLANSSLILEKIEKSVPMLAHGAAAAFFLSGLSPAVPENVISAVRMHTFPEDKCGAIEMALVMADFLDPSRQNSKRDKLRNEKLDPEKRFKKVLRIKHKK